MHIQTDNDDDVIASTEELPPEFIYEGEKLEKFLSGGKPWKATVRRIHGFIDKTNKILKLDEKSPCSRSCSACCEKPVDITRIEAYYLHTIYGMPVTDKLTKGSDNIMHPPEEYAGKPCPFLKDNECQVYEHRPIPCRVFHSMEKTPDKCGYGMKSTQYNLRSHSIYGALIDHISANESLSGSGDVRDFFGVEPIEINK